VCVPPAGPRTFPRSLRILRAAEFRLIYDQGLRVSSPFFTAFCLAHRSTADAAGPRIGLTVPRAVGRAVERNRMKRRLREAFRLHRSELGAQWDIVFNPRRAILKAEFADVERALMKVIQKCNSSQP